MTDALRIGIGGALALALFACGGPPPGGEDAGDPGGGDAGSNNNGGDVTAPALIATTPASSAVDVDVSLPLALEFSEPMDTASVQVSLSPSVDLGAAAWSFGDTVVTFTPPVPMTYDTLYSVTVTGKDVAGNAVSAPTFTFTTGPMPDLTPPSITATTPAEGATDVATTTHLSITFSRPMDISTVTVSGSPSYDPGMPTWDAENVTATFDAPAAELDAATQYTFTVAGKDTGARDLTGTNTFTFTTAAPPDSTPPTVANTAPADGANGVPITTNLSFTFSEPMNKATVEAAFSATPAVSCVFLWDSSSQLMTCDPSSDLAYSTGYSVTLGTGAEDVNGNALAAPYTLTFDTAAAPDTTPPTITDYTPANGAIGVSRSTHIVVTFSEPMDKASAQAAFAITSPSGLSGGVFSWNSAGTVMTYNTPATLDYGDVVAWQVSTTAQDLAGNALSATVSRSFRAIRSATAYLYSQTTLDGHVTSTNVVDTNNGTIIVGDFGIAYPLFQNYAFRGFLTFDLSPLNSSLTYITAATLRVYQTNNIGTPFGTGSANLGYLRAESVNYGLSLTSGDYSTSTLSYSYTLSSSASSGTKQASVASKVRDDWTNRSSRGYRSQFRLRFSLRDMTPDFASDQVSIYAGEASNVSQRPRLAVTYEYP